MHITEVAGFALPQVDINCMIKAAKQHTSFQCSMIIMQLTDIMDLDATVRLNMVDNGNEGVGEILLHYVSPKHI